MYHFRKTENNIQRTWILGNYYEVVERGTDLFDKISGGSAKPDIVAFVRGSNSERLHSIYEGRDYYIMCGAKTIDRVFFQATKPLRSREEQETVDLMYKAIKS